jgi:hypothetical protein
MRSAAGCLITLGRNARNRLELSWSLRKARRMGVVVIVFLIAWAVLALRVSGGDPHLKLHLS